MFSRKLFKISFDLTHVLFEIPAGKDHLTGRNRTGLVVDPDQDNRDTRFQGGREGRLERASQGL